MKKLKNKIFILLFSILSIFVVSVIVMYNYTLYNNEYKEIENKFRRTRLTHEKFNDGINPNRDIERKDPMFIDSIIYVVTFDTNGDISNVKNYSNDGASEEDIIKIVMSNKNILEVNKINNLYFNKYIFSINKNMELVIINNSDISNRLVKTLFMSLFLLFVLELFIIFISNELSKKLVKPVEDSFEKQKQFVYDASHELKTPLSIIMASAETLENNPKDTKWLNNIKEESEKMNKLVKDLLELSKTEDFNNNYIYQEVDLSRVIRNKALSFESLMYERDLFLKTNIENNIKFNCDSDRIKEVLSILIDNAIEHAFKKSEIIVNLSKSKDNIILEVINSGREIPIGERDKIFERFYRIDKSRNRNSNRYGLGLSIAKNIINNHNGIIFVDCKNNLTIFRIILKQN